MSLPQPFGDLPAIVQLTEAQFLDCVKNHDPSLLDLRVYVSSASTDRWLALPAPLVSADLDLPTAGKLIGHSHGQRLWDYIVKISRFSQLDSTPTRRAIFDALENFCVSFVVAGTLFNCASRMRLMKKVPVAKGICTLRCADSQSLILRFFFCSFYLVLGVDVWSNDGFCECVHFENSIRLP